ncbi:MAG: glycosyltransferase family 4 protein [Candidatus Pacearchaeota archaeon]
MRILEIASPIFKKTAGIERVIYELSKNFKKLGNDVFVLTQKIEDPLKGIGFIFKKPSKKFLEKIKKEKGINIIHSHGAASTFCDVVTMNSCHKAYVKTTDLLRRISPRNIIVILRENKVVKNAKLVIAVSKLVKKKLIKEYGIQPNKIKVIYNGINLKEFYFKRKFTQLKKREIRLLFIGNYFKRKGLKELLLALAIIKDKPFKLFVAGKDNPNPYIKLSKKLGIAEKIFFLGHCKNVASLYKKSDIFVFPTKMEPCSLAELEAMAAGLALVISDKKFNGVAELLKDKGDCILIKNPSDPKEIANKINYLLENRQLIKKLGLNAQKKALKFDWKNISKQYLKLFKRLK